MDAIRKILLTALLGLMGLSASAQKMGEATTRCEVGFLYQISYQPNWGDSRAVVAEVFPGSPAAEAGLRVGDIIETINGLSTQEISEEELTRILLDPNHGSVELTISNFAYRSKPVTIRKKCIPIDALSEAVLARSFNMYSLEDVTDRRFTMPFSYNTPAEVDFINFKSFSFERGKRPTAEERSIQAELQRKGLVYVEKGGDLLVSVHAKLEANPSYREGAESDVEMGLKNYRLNTEKGDIQQYPFLSINAPSFTGTHKLTIEVDIFDAATNTKIWSGIAREKLNGTYSSERYMQNFAPLLMSNFPFVRYLMNPSFVMHKNTYRSIGIYLDANDLQRVLWVDKNSPAEKAGIKAGDRIVTINGIPLEKSVKVATEHYFNFVKKSFDLRDEETRFPSNDGFQNNRYWRLDKYSEISAMIQNPAYRSVFSYLFSHRSYVHSPIIEDIILEVKRGESTEPVLIKPVKVAHDYVELF